MRHDDVLRILHEPLAQELLHSGHLARLAYTGLDGYPRAVPIGFLWSDQHLIICTASGAAKVPALRERPEVALTIDTDTRPPRALLLRGVATIDIVDGVPDEFLQTARKVGDPEWREEIEAGSRDLYDQMARIRIAPHWAKLLDFETVLPSAVEDLIRRKYPDGQ